MVFWVILLCLPAATAQTQVDDRHIAVTLRMIGHQMLLRAGDSNSRVLPVQKNGDSYQLNFASSFGIEPDKLVGLVDSLVRNSHIAQSYLVEIRECNTREVVYSFEMGRPARLDIVPCRGRELPVACYTLLFSILEPSLVIPDPGSPETEAVSSLPAGSLPMAVSAALLIILTALWFYFWKKPGSHEGNASMIALGGFDFDTRNMELSLGGEKTALTAKETDLLSLLYSSANTTVPRDTILNQVWGDEGDYVGRTLDVFISKLRKKLEADPRLKIVNVRGVGYKLVVNE